MKNKTTCPDCQYLLEDGFCEYCCTDWEKINLSAQHRSEAIFCDHSQWLKWNEDKSYWYGDHAEFAWAEGTKDLHWMARGEQLALYDNEYDRATQISWVSGRSQEETKALAQRLQNVLESSSTPTPEMEK